MQVIMYLVHLDIAMLILVLVLNSFKINFCFKSRLQHKDCSVIVPIIPA